MQFYYIVNKEEYGKLSSFSFVWKGLYIPSPHSLMMVWLHLKFWHDGSFPFVL